MGRNSKECTLEKLVHKRMDIDTLVIELKKVLPELTYGFPDKEDLMEGEDNRLDIADKEGTGSIWYLNTNCDEEPLYITEVCYEED